MFRIFRRRVASRRGWQAVTLLAAVCLSTASAADLAAELRPSWECLAGKRDAFSLAGSLQLPDRGDDQPGDTVAIAFVRYSAAAFDLEASHNDYAFVLRRRADETALALPRHGRVFLARGQLDPTDHLAPAGSLARLVSPDSAAAVVLPALAGQSPALLATLAETLLGLEPRAEPRSWGRAGLAIRFADDGRAILSAAGATLTLEIGDPGMPPDVADFPGLAVETLLRGELERTLARGVRRATEILLPGPMLKDPPREPRDVPRGTLRWAGEQRVVTLWGTPEQIGTAHGQLLRTEAWRCIDSVLGVVGVVETVRSGRWFRHRLEEASDRLAPHIPERHTRETAALARAIDCPPDLFAAVNVFPELFHCSGFAVTGSATPDGTLYHGRVLDYMTRIGLQDSAAVFAVAPEGRLPFVSVGYAGFTGSVSGMNAAGVSLGEMGGGGEGRWDGVPMATLMRRACEECRTLDEVLALWRESPRTCEYYYVFADAKGRRAVGVAATPEAVEVVQLGEAHPRLGPGIPDAVALSSGSRLDCLRERISERHGGIDTAAAMRLMDRPVAASSNLHNVLFVPERLELHVAHASHDAVAAERPSVRLSLADLLAAVPAEALSDAAVAPVAAGACFPAADSLRPGPEPAADSAACLAGLVWTPESFEVTLHDAEQGRGELAIEFPSPRPSGDARNDRVWIEWYRPRDCGPWPERRSACVVVHESGSSMQFGRLIARGLREHGAHAFLVHLPHYGRRRDPAAKPGPEKLIPAVTQAVADVRRARDAVAALPGVDAGRIGLQGTSLGGFVATTASALDRGYAKTFIMLAGADLPAVLANGRKDAAKVRAKLAAAGMTDREVHGTLHAIEPLRLAHRLAPHRTWLYSGRFDDVVPPANADLLATAAGLPDTHHIRLAADHYTGVLYLPVVLAQVAKQLEQP